MTTRTESAKATRRSRAATICSRPSQGREAETRLADRHRAREVRLSPRRSPRASYDEPGGIRDLLMALTEYGWKPVEEGGNVIALSGPDGTVSLEPAGQLELSGRRARTSPPDLRRSGPHLAR
jgi:glutamate--cysteine ligase